jgi:hypothetical protein
VSALHLVPDPDRAHKLARFRADPAKVRVTVHRAEKGGGELGYQWWAEVSSRETGEVWARVWHEDANKAVMYALRRASGRDGVDLSMGCAYEHPWGAAGVAARGDER